MEGFHFWTIPVVAMMAYFMIHVEMIAEEIEDPFGESEDDLMLDDLCLTIERSVEGILAARELEPDHPPVPVLLASAAAIGPAAAPY